MRANLKSALTGQSGPPTSNATLERDMPLDPTKRRIALIKVEFIPTVCRTLTKCDRCSPITFCWIAHASNFNKSPLTIEYEMDPSQPMMTGMRRVRAVTQFLYSTKAT